MNHLKKRFYSKPEEDNMCIAIPGRVVELNEDRAKVDFNGNLVDVNTADRAGGGTVRAGACRMRYRSDGARQGAGADRTVHRTGGTSVVSWI